MRKTLLLGTLLLVFMMATVLTIPGCDKERIVTSTEKVQEIEYIELPPDTVILVDTVYVGDSVTQTIIDTVFVGGDTVYQTLYDTVEVVTHHYDTTVITQTDTVSVSECAPLVHFAYAALHAWGDAAVIDFINAQYGYEDGWVFYGSLYQTAIDNPSTGVYDFWGYIDFWSPDWSEFIPIEYGFRMTFDGGDASDPNNWTMSDAPSGSPSGISPGLNPSTAERRETNR